VRAAKSGSGFTYHACILFEWQAGNQYRVDGEYRPEVVNALRAACVELKPPRSRRASAAHIAESSYRLAEACGAQESQSGESSVRHASAQIDTWQNFIFCEKYR
jgi:hypothetical protein